MLLIIGLLSLIGGCTTKNKWLKGLSIIPFVFALWFYANTLSIDF